VHDARAVDSRRSATESVAEPRFNRPLSDRDRIGLDMPYAENDAAKAAGARWDWAMRAWSAVRLDSRE
jgi:hypothetical protein